LETFLKLFTRFLGTFINFFHFFMTIKKFVNVPDCKASGTSPSNFQRHKKV